MAKAMQSIALRPQAATSARATAPRRAPAEPDVLSATTSQIDLTSVLAGSGDADASGPHGAMAQSTSANMAHGLRTAPAKATTTSAVPAYLGRAFGADFSGVRVRRDSRPECEDAWALTVGETIHVAPSVGSLDGPHGRRLLAHELSHVVQQRAGARGTSVLSEVEAEARADAAADAVIHGRAVPSLGASTPHAVQHKKKPPPPGGGVLYIGMNNFKAEVSAIDSYFAGVDINLPKVTVSNTESAFKDRGVTYDLTADAGCDSFAATLSSDAKVVSGSATLLKAQRNADRDDLAHVMRVYATTQADGVDRMSRVVLSGHSYGTKIYNEIKVKDRPTINIGQIVFDALVTLAGLFQAAAGQTRHLIALACFAGEESIIVNTFKKAFPNLVSFYGWTSLCPTGWGAAKALVDWLKVTDKDPKTTLPMLPQGRSNWIAGQYQEDDWRSDKELLDHLRGEDATFKKYFDGDSVDADNHSGPLFDYYRRARSASNRASITGVDHDFVQKAADQSFRLRFWKGMASHFWNTHKAVLSAAKVPNFSRMTRKKTMETITTFLASGGAKGFDAAAALLRQLRDLDAKALHDDWLEP